MLGVVNTNRRYDPETAAVMAFRSTGESLEVDGEEPRKRQSAVSLG
jgi:hypothetical protein